jgi:hypothetical protein
MAAKNSSRDMLKRLSNDPMEYVMGFWQDGSHSAKVKTPIAARTKTVLMFIFMTHLVWSARASSG